MGVSESRITAEIHAWQDHRQVISDNVALDLFRQYRGSSDYPFAGVGPTGIVDDAEGLLAELAATRKAIPYCGNLARHEELAVLEGWVHNWIDNHVDVDNEEHKHARVFPEEY